MVSAYEAHIINVTAHPEIALKVDITEVDFGTVFPEEWFTVEKRVTTSISFCEDSQTRVGNIYFDVYAQWKPIPGTEPTEYYNWLGDGLYLGFYNDPQTPPATILAGDLTNVGAAPASMPGHKLALDKDVAGNDLVVQKFPLPPDLSCLVIGLDVPVFEGYWNIDTDVPTKPSGMSGPSYVIPKLLPTGAPNPAWNPDGVDLGLDIVIQVTGID